MFGKLIGMQGNVLKIVLDEDLDMAPIHYTLRPTTLHR